MSVAVYLRRSKDEQDATRQINAVGTVLVDNNWHVPEALWFSEAGSRHHSSRRQDFQSLLSLIEKGAVKTVVVESQDRWGTSGYKEYFHLLHVLGQHRARLISAKEGDLTKGDIATDAMAFFNAYASSAEQRKIAARNLEQKIGFARNEGRWLGGVPPYGYDKACFNEDGKLLWILRYHDKQTWTQLVGDKSDDGKGPGPRKAKKSEWYGLVLSTPDRVQAVQNIFLLWTDTAISLRGIANHLNSLGLRCNGKAFTGILIKQILTHPVYVGNYTYNRTTYAAFRECKNGNFVDVQPEQLHPIHNTRSKEQHTPEDWIVKEDHYPAIVDADTFHKAQAKLQTRVKTDLAPRNDEHFFKGLLYCGHCGQRLLPKKDGKRNKVEYICSSYLYRTSNQVSKSDCARFAVPHVEAVRIVGDYLTDHEERPSQTLEGQVIVQLLRAQKENDIEMYKSFKEALAYYFETLAREVVAWEANPELMLLLSQVGTELQNTPPEVITTRDFCEKFFTRFAALDDMKCEGARRQLDKLKEQHRRYTEKWLEADGLQATLLKATTDQLLQQIHQAEAQAVPLAAKMARATQQRQAIQQALDAARTAMAGRDNRRIAEALRAAIKRIVFFWDTTRTGKYSRSTLREWHIELSDLHGEQSPTIQIRQTLAGLSYLSSCPVPPSLES